MLRWRGILPEQRRQKQLEPRKAGAKKPAGSIIMIVSVFYPSVDDSVNRNNAVAEQLQMNRKFLSILFLPSHCHHFHFIVKPIFFLPIVTFTCPLWPM